MKVHKTNSNVAPSIENSCFQTLQGNAKQIQHLRSIRRYHVVQVAGHVGEGEVRVAVDGDIGRVPVLAHADGAGVVDSVVRHLVRRALGADQPCARPFTCQTLSTAQHPALRSLGVHSCVDRSTACLLAAYIDSSSQLSNLIQGSLPASINAIIRRGHH